MSTVNRSEPTTATTTDQAAVPNRKPEANNSPKRSASPSVGTASARRRDDRAGNPRRLTAWATGLGLAVISVAAGLAYNPAEPHFDELYHVLAAQSVLSGDGLSIAEGTYTRARGFTYAVAAAMGLAGDSLEASRWPSILCLAAAVALIVRWVWGMAGALPAVLAGLGAMLMPGTLFAQGMTRFYTPQLLFVMLAAWLVYRVTVGEVRAQRDGQYGARTLRFGDSVWLLDRADVLRLIGAGVCVLLGLHMQPTTILPAAALGAWLWAWWAAGLLVGPARSAWGPRLVWGAATLAGLAAVGLAFQMEMWTKFRSAAAWSAASANDPTYYHEYFMSLYAWWWVATPVLALAAVARGRIAVVFVLVLLLISLAGQSVSGMKAPRYVVYLSPWLAMVWAIGAVEIARLVRETLTASLHAVVRGPLPMAWPVRVGPTLAVSLAVLPLVYYTPAQFTLRTMLDGDATTWHRFQQLDWPGLATELTPKIGKNDTVISSAETKAIYFLGRSDLAIGVAQLVTHGEGQVDPRTGSPTISAPASIEAAVADSASGWVIVERPAWRSAFGVPDTTADRIDALTTAVPLPASLEEQFVVRRWGMSDSDETGSGS